MELTPGATRVKSGHNKSKSARLGSLYMSNEEFISDDELVFDSGSASGRVASTDSPKKGHKKSLSYMKILNKLRGVSTGHKTFSCVLVGDEVSGPIPLLLSLLEPSFHLRFEPASVQEGQWDWTSASQQKVTLQLFGMTLDPKLAYESVRGMFLSETRKCDIVLLTFSLVSPLSLQRAVRTHQMMVQALSTQVGNHKHEMPLIFLVGTMRELRDAVFLASQQSPKINMAPFHELVRHYVNQGLLTTEDARAMATGQMRLVTEAKIREAMLAVNATSYAEVCFLPTVGNVTRMFAELAERAGGLRRSSGSKSPGGPALGHRRSRSSASRASSTPVVGDEDNEEILEDLLHQSQLVGLAMARFPDAFTMASDTEAVGQWLEAELPHLTRANTPRDGLSRSDYKLLLQASPGGQANNMNGDSCPTDGVHRKEWPNGDVYHGGWHHGMYEGQGTLSLANGCAYSGSFGKGFFHGQGELRSPDGSFYRGAWSEGKRNGKGEQRYADGSTYVGYWKDDERDGEGVLSYANGTTYVGGFQRDQFHGKGRYTFNTGSLFEGTWEAGKKQGEGTLHRFDGTLRRLSYKDDVLLSQENIQVHKKDRRPPSIHGTQLSSSAFNLMTSLDLSELKIDESAPLGEGYYGIVLRGTYRGMEVAVKRLRPNLPDNALAKFLSEVTILAGLQNDYIVRYLGAVFEERNLCIVTEYYSGGTLWEKIHDRATTFTMAFIHQVALQIALAVRYLHFECSPPIIHRDLKSPNILLTHDLTVKVADFGLARLLAKSDDEATMTKGIGTASWTAPEIMRSQAYSEKADVYSYAVIVWELFARKPPFHPLERDQIVIAVVVDNARPQMPAEVPVSWKSFIENCWQLDPTERPNFKEIVEWLLKNK